MSIERAHNLIRREPLDRIPIFDMPMHAAYVRYLTGIDPVAEPRRAVVEAMRRLDIDIGMGWVPPTLAEGSAIAEWRNRETTRGDIFGYDPFAREDMAGMSFEDAAAEARRQADDDKAMYGDIAIGVGRTFTTLIHYAAEDLDWEEFLAMCLLEEERVDRLLDRFEECSVKNVRAWVESGVEIMLTHDDIAMSTGTVQSPEWLRKHVISRYPSVFAPIRKKGITHLFMSDGDWSAVAEDIAALGVDGFFIDPPCVDLEWLANTLGPDLIYYTGPTPATFETGSVSDMRAAVKDIADMAHELMPHFCFHSTGSIMMPSVPRENIASYFDACLEFGGK